MRHRDAAIGGAMRRTAVIALLTIAPAVTCSWPVHAQTVMDRINRDEVFRLPKDDPDMAAAMRKARETLPQFLTLWRTPRASTSHFAVKVGIKDDVGGIEYFWIAPFTEKDGRYSGRID